MHTEHPAPEEFDRYLRLLGVPARAPGLGALAELVAAHLVRVPFENLSKLYHRADESMRLPVLGRFLDGIEHHHFGGTCYSNNSHLSLLLAHLGYDVRLCGADMTQPDVHVVNVVTLDGREFLVDAGYGAPFLSPMPLDLPREHVIELGADRWVLMPRAADGSSRLAHYRGGQLRHGYRVKPAGRRIEEFAGVIASSFSERATFMNALMMVRFTPDGSVALHNLKLTECTGLASRTRELAGPAELPDAIERHFGIHALTARTALAGVDLARDVFD